MMNIRNPRTHGERKTSTLPYERRVRRLRSRRRSADTWVAIAATRSLLSQRRLPVDLRRDALEPGLERDVARLPLVQEVVPERRVRVAVRGERFEVRLRVGEDVQEDLELRVGGGRHFLQGIVRGRHVPQRLRKLNLGSRVGGQVF